MTDLVFDFPAPGEPLKKEVHPKNQALLDEEVARRVEMARSKLTRRQLNNLKAEYAKLHRALNRAGYNRLMVERAELVDTFNALKALYQKKPSDKLKKELLSLQKAGFAIDAKLQKIQPQFERFEEIKRRLKTHEQILQYEREEKENTAAFFREATVWEQQILAVFRQSPRLHHKAQDKKGNEIIRIPKIEQILLKVDKIYFQIKLARQGILDRFMERWHSALPYGVDVEALTCDDTIKNLTAVCGRVVTVERSSRSQNLFYVIHRMDSADGLPKLVRFDQVTDHYPMDRHLSTPWAAGLGEDHKIVHFDFEQHFNILIAGSVGGGKSNLINAAVSQWITMNSPDELRLLLIDNKGGVELSHFEDIPHLLTPPVISIDGVVPALKMVHQIITERLAAFQQVKARKLLVYNQRVKNPLPRLVVVIDEMATLLGLKDTPDIHNELRVISSQGRATGVHLVVCTQHPSVDVLPGWIKTNLTLRIAFRMPNHVASQIIVDSITAAHLPEIAGRAVFRRGGFEQILQTPLIEDAGIAKAVKIAQQFPPARWQLQSAAIEEPARTEADTDEYTPIPMEESITKPVPMPTPVMEKPQPVFGREEYLRAALALDGSLSPSRIYEHVAKNYFTQIEARKFGNEMVEQLVKEGKVCIDGIWYIVDKLPRGYKLIQSVEQPVTETPNDEEAVA